MSDPGGWIERAVYDVLNADADVTAAAGGRITPDKRTQGTAAATSVVVAAGVQTPLSGFSGVSGTWAGSVVLEISAETRRASRRVATACGLALARFRGDAGGLCVQSFDYDEDAADLQPIEGSDDDRYDVLLSMVTVYDVPDGDAVPSPSGDVFYRDACHGGRFPAGVEVLPPPPPIESPDPCEGGRFPAGVEVLT